MTLPIDLIIVAIFFIIIFTIGFLERKKIDIDDYWVNSRNTKKLIIVATVTSTHLGVGSTFANAGVAFSGGGLATLVLMASFFLYFLIFSKFFAPKIKEFGDKYKAYTLPDFLEHRYSKRVRVAGLMVNLLTYGFWLSLQILGIGIFVSSVSDVNQNLAILIGGAIVVAYTSIGGLRADIRTDVFQFLVMLTLIFIFIPIVFLKSGGLDTITQLPATYLSGQEFAPWYIFLFAFLVIGASSIVTADLWQRVYAADSVKSVKWAFKVAAFIIFLFLISGTLLGILGHAVVPDATANNVIPELLKLYLSPVVFGLILAGFFAAIMSSADTVLLVMSMTLVHDLYQKSLNKELTPDQVLKVSRWTTFVLGAIAVLLAITIFNVIHLAIDALTFLVALLPAVVFGFYWKKARESAAFWSIVLGTLTIVVILPFSAIYAFVPGILVSFTTFFIVSKLDKKSVV